MGIEALSPRVQRLVREADNSHSFSTELKNEWNYTSISPCAFLACRGKSLIFCLTTWSVRVIDIGLLTHFSEVLKSSKSNRGVWSTSPLDCKRRPVSFCEDLASNCLYYRPWPANLWRFFWTKLIKISFKGHKRSQRICVIVAYKIRYQTITLK